jgi:hypothetical protein
MITPAIPGESGKDAAMKDYQKLARPYLVLLAIFVVGRWLTGLSVPYERGHQVFSIVILTFNAAVFYGAFARRWRGYSIVRAMALAAFLGLMSQLAILGATVLSYALGVDTYFTHPRALNVEAPLPFGEALKARIGGLVVNPIVTAIAGAIGWVLGALLPERRQD